MREIKSLDELDQLVSTSSNLIVIDYYADWCGPCKQMVPFLEKLAASNPNVIFVKVNTGNITEVVDKHKINGLPTFKLMKNQQLLQTITGADANAVAAAVKQHA